MPMLKVFATAKQVAAVAPEAPVVETYPAFCLVDAEGADERAITRALPTEDMSEHYQLELGGELADPLAKSTPARTRSRAVKAAALPAGPHHYIVQFIGPVKRSWVSALTAAGATLRSPMPGFAYVVKADKKALARIEALGSVRWVGHLPHEDRVAAPLMGAEPDTELPRKRVVPDAVIVEVFDGADIPAIERSARALGFSVLSSDAKARTIKLAMEGTAKQQRDKVKALSAVHGVRYIRERTVPRTSNNVATALMGNAFAAVQPAGLKLSGKGEIVAVCDTGLDTGNPATIHPDFAGRVLAVKSYPITPDWNIYITNPGSDDGPADFDSGHGTHVAGSVLGNGTASAALVQPIRGHASGARLVFQAIEQEMKWRPSAPAKLRADRYILAGIPANLAALFQFAYAQGARIHSNSWGGGDAGAYDEQCRQFDEFVWRNKDMCFVIAAGNDGTDKDGDGKINLGSVTSPGTAKNCVTVGACENLRPEFNSRTYGASWPDDYPAAPIKNDPMANDPAQVVAFSSRGPTTDGRIKPDVVAPGTFILSTRSTQIAANNFAWAALPGNKMYFHMGGTSMATPLTSGALALLREFLRTRRGMASPSAALLKALLIAGANRLPKTAAASVVLDNHQGFGAVNLDRSLKSVQLTLDAKGLQTGQSARTVLQLPTSGKTLRIVMAYSDFPGKGLINNLNLIVTSPSGERFVGNMGGGSGNALKMDAANNAELVQVAAAAKGAWTIDVIASNVPKGPQDYALAAVLV